MSYVWYGTMSARLREEEDADLALFHRAICDHDQAAWAAIYHRFHGHVLAWVRRHPASHYGDEDEEYVVNRAFERFYTAVGPDRLGLFPGLPQVLGYLKLCVRSVIVDAARRQWALVEPLDEREPAAAMDVAATVAEELMAQELWQAITEEAHDADERIVADACWVRDLQPREVYVRHPDRFPTVADVYRVKRNLLDRLRRSSTIQRFLSVDGRQAGTGPQWGTERGALTV